MNMAKPIKAKTIVSTVKKDSWFGLKYNMNLYRSCQHGRIYCGKVIRSSIEII
jgi:DNA repair photolyase